MQKSSKTGHSSNPWHDPRDPLPRMASGSRQYEMVPEGPSAVAPGLVKPHKRQAGQPAHVPKIKFPTA